MIAGNDEFGNGAVFEYVKPVWGLQEDGFGGRKICCLLFLTQWLQLPSFLKELAQFFEQIGLRIA